MPEAPCPCGLRNCRSGWPEDAPPPAQLPDPLRWLDDRMPVGPDSGEWWDAREDAGD